MTQSASDHLRKEIGFLGAVLGDIIAEFEGEPALETVEALRRTAWDRRSGREGADERMRELIANLDDQAIGRRSTQPGRRVEIPRDRESRRQQGAIGR